MPFALSGRRIALNQKHIMKKKNNSQIFTLKDCRSNVNNNITNNVQHIRKLKKLSKTILPQNAITLDISRQFIQTTEHGQITLT